MLDLVLLADVDRTHAVRVVDRIDDDGLERMFALRQQGTRRQELPPGRHGHLVGLEGIESGFGGEEDSFVRSRAEGRLSNLPGAEDQC